MAQETLSLKITADNKDAIAGLNETTAALNKTANDASATGQAVAKGSNQAANALQNLGRVAQDAPFGFIGIQNNLNPLLESFQRLKAETGSTGGALKALASSLTGAGGLGLALSVASSLFLVFGDRLFSAGEKAKKVKEDFDKINETVAQNVLQVRLLYGAYQKSNTTQEQRVEIIKELQSLAPQQFANLDAEKTSYEQLAKAVNDYNQSISNKIRAEIKKKDLEELIKQEEPLKKLIALQEDFNMRMKTGRTSTDAQEKLNALLEKEEKLEKQINELIDIRIKKPKDTGGHKEKIKENESLIESDKKMFDEYMKLYYKMFGQRPGAYAYGSGREFAQEELQTPKKLDQKINFEDLFGKDHFQTGEENLKKFNEQLANSLALASFTADAFSNLFDSMQQGLSLGDALGKMFEDLANQIMKAAIKAAIFAIVLNITTGGGASLAGFGDIFKSFLGGGGFGSNKKGFAEGGISHGSQGGHYELLHGTEAIFPMDKLAKYTDRAMGIGAAMSMGRNNEPIIMDTRVAGNDIWISQKRTDFSRSLTT